MLSLNMVKLKVNMDQSDLITEPWPDFDANRFRMCGKCRNTFNNSADIACICHLPIISIAASNLLCITNIVVKLAQLQHE